MGSMKEYSISVVNKSIRRRYRTITPTISDSIIGNNLFGKTLKGMRLGSGITVKRLAKKTNLSIDYIYKLERGFSPAPGAPRIDRLAEAMGTNSDPLYLAAGVVTEKLAKALVRNPAVSCEIVSAIGVPEEKQLIVA